MIFNSFDYETTGLRPYHGDRIFSYCIGSDTGSVDIRRVDRKDKVTNWKKLKSFFKDTSIGKIAHNLKFELSMNYVHGIEYPEETIFHDTMMMSRMLRSDAPSHKLDDLCRFYCGDSELTREWDRIDNEVARIFKVTDSYQKIPKYLMDEYQKADGERTMLLFELFYPIIKKDTDLYNSYKVEIQTVITTQRLESHGIRFSPWHAKKLIVWMQEELDKIQHKLYDMFGEYINLNSDKEIIRLLFGKLDMPILKYTKNKNPVVDKDAIFFLQKENPHPVLDCILKQRSYTKGISIIKGYEKSCKEVEKGIFIIFPNINTNHASTGRMTSNNPNLQNVSKRKGLKNPYPVPARQCYIPRPNCFLAMTDYSGIEMVIAVQCTGSKRLIKLLTEKFDFHSACAESFFGDRFTKETNKEIKSMLRSAAKNARFAMLYGGGIYTVANTLLLSVKEAKYGKDRDKERFPEFYDLMDECSSIAREKGYIETLFGRKLYVQKHKSYVATDYRVQGTAAEVFKRGEVAVDNLLKIAYPDIRLLVPVHDELMMEIPRYYLQCKERVMGEISEKMTAIDRITVPLRVEWKMSSTTWDNAKEVKIEY